MELCTTIADLHSFLGSRQPAFVPTMGALHDGHAALIRRARTIAGDHGLVAVSIFVNPTQFAPHEDLSRYPRQLDKDRAVCEQAGADVIFVPDVQEMYPAGPAKVSDTFFMPRLPAVATKPKLEDRFRPTHFEGVVKVVARLFDVVQPSHAVFGEKDYQQLRVITDMVRQQNSMDCGRTSHDNAGPLAEGSLGAPDCHPGLRWPAFQVVAHPTVRERDGLAMSSRNVYLTGDQRKTALTLWRAISEAKQKKSPAAAEDVMRVVLEEAGLDIDYAAVRDSATLMPVERYDRPCRALIAAKIGGVGGTRLIDNMPIGPHG